MTSVIAGWGSDVDGGGRFAADAAAGLFCGPPKWTKAVVIERSIWTLVRLWPDIFITEAPGRRHPTSTLFLVKLVATVFTFVSRPGFGSSRG